MKILLAILMTLIVTAGLSQTASANSERKITRTGELYIKALVEFARDEIRRNNRGRTSDAQFDRIFCEKIKEIVDLDHVAEQVTTRRAWRKLKAQPGGADKFKNKFAKILVENFKRLFDENSRVLDVSVINRSNLKRIDVNASLKVRVAGSVNTQFDLKYNSAFSRLNLTHLSYISRYIKGEKTYRGVNLQREFPKMVDIMTRGVKIRNMEIGGLMNVTKHFRDHFYSKYLRSNRNASVDQLIAAKVTAPESNGGLGIPGTCE